MFCTNIIIGWSANRLIASGRFKRVVIRKAFNSFGQYGCACGLVFLAWAECNTAWAVSALCISLGLLSGCFGGFLVILINLKVFKISIIDYGGMGFVQGVAGCE